MDNKVTFGLKNVHYSTFTVENGVITYAAPVPIPGGIELSLEPRGDMVEFYADNMLYYSAQNNQGYNGTLSIANIPEKFSIDALGEEKDGTDMVLTEKLTSKGKQFALLFEFDGDKKGTRHVLYNCTANRPTVGSSTKTDSVEPNANELTFVASGREGDGSVKTKTTPSTPGEIYDGWYTEVYEPKSDTTAPTVTVSPIDGSTGVAVTSNVVWTFSEAIRESDVTGANFFIVDELGAEVPGALTLNADQTIVTFNPTADLSALTEYTAMATKNVRDIAGNALAQNSVVNFTTA
jgi:phi13 family phage major tail protein